MRKLALVLVVLLAPACGDDDGWSQFRCANNITAVTDGKELVCWPDRAAPFAPRPWDPMTDNAQTACAWCAGVE